MEKIKSTTELIFDARHHKSGFVEIELTEWRERGTHFTAEITDFFLKPVTITNDEGEPEEIIQRIPTYSRPINIEAEKVNELASVLASVIPEGVPESTRRSILKSQALLYYVKTDFLEGHPDKCIYFTDPEQWIIPE